VKKTYYWCVTQEKDAGIALDVIYRYSEKGTQMLGELMNVPEVRKEVDEFLNE
jgi:hypothetical protein